MSQLDHIVIAAPDLQSLVDEFHARTGVQPVAGGQHAGRGTANYLVGLGEGRYIELIGPDPEQDDPSEARPLRVDDVTATTMVGWATRPDDIDARVRSAREAGYDPGDPKPMDRRTPDGDLLEWRLTPPSGGLGGTIPFLIDWQDSVHPSEGLPSVTLLSLELTHPNPEAVRTALDAVDALECVAEIFSGTTGLAITLETPNGQVRFG